MKHLKTFESFLNESISAKAKALKTKLPPVYGEHICGLVSDWYKDVKNDGGDLENANTAMKVFGTDPKTTLYANAGNNEDEFDKFMDEVRKSGLIYKELTNVDGFAEVFISGK